MTRSQASLVLHAQNSDWRPDDLEQLVDQLQRIGLAGEAIPQQANSYLAGEKFLELVSFLGCSPGINLAADETTERYSFIRVHSSAEICALTGKNSHAPLCPQCKKPEKNWRDKLEHHRLQCASCGSTSEPWLYNWRKSAGFGRCFIEITEIYPHEAIPQSGLLAALEAFSQQRWMHFYHQP